MNPQSILILVILLMMIISNFTNDSQMFLQRVAFGLPAVIIALTFHEFAHAFAASKLGDPTPKFQGSLTIDVRKHIDPIGLILFLFAGFGWAKPVETDPRYLKNPKRDMGIIAAAGPVVNIILGIITIIIASKLGMDSSSKFGMLFGYIATYNLVFAVFNLIPIPPLDGSKIIKAFLSYKNYYKYTEFEYKYQFHMMIGLLAVIFFVPDFLGEIIFFFVAPLEKIALILANLLPF